MPRSNAPRFDDFLASLEIEPVEAPAKPPLVIKRESDGTPQADPMLAEKVWKSYTEDEWMIFSCPPGFVRQMLRQLQAARRYLHHVHQNDDPKPDIRGLEKAHVHVIVPSEITDPKHKFAKYLPAIRQGEVGVLFLAHPPRALGRRAQRMKEEGTFNRKPQREYRREWREDRKAQQRDAGDREVRTFGSESTVLDPFRRTAR